MMWFLPVRPPGELKVGMTALGRAEAEGENMTSLSPLMLGVVRCLGLPIGPPWNHRMQFLE